MSWFRSGAGFDEPPPPPGLLHDSVEDRGDTYQTRCGAKPPGGRGALKHDIEKLFGIRAVRLQKRIEVIVKLVQWEDGIDYERLGLEDKFSQVLGVEVPVVTIPVSPGKNITVISEVIAMNHMLKVYGENTAERFSQRLAEEIKRRRATGGYLEADTE